MKIFVITKKVYIECFVESESNPKIKYMVVFDKQGWRCACKNYKIHKQICKHIKFVKEDQKI